MANSKIDATRRSRRRQRQLLQNSTPHDGKACHGGTARGAMCRNCPPDTDHRSPNERCTQWCASGTRGRHSDTVGTCSESLLLWQRDDPSSRPMARRRRRCEVNCGYRDIASAWWHSRSSRSQTVAAHGPKAHPPRRALAECRTASLSRRLGQIRSCCRRACMSMARTPDRTTFPSGNSSPTGGAATRSRRSS